VPKLIRVGHGAKQIQIGLMLERQIALDFRQQMLFQFANGALPLQEVTYEKSDQHAKAKECHTQRPLVVLVGMDKDQRVHESRQATSKDQDKNHGKHRQLELTSLQLVELLPVENCCAAHASCSF